MSTPTLVLVIVVIVLALIALGLLTIHVTRLTDRLNLHQRQLDDQRRHEDLRMMAIEIWTAMIAEGRAGDHVPALIEAMQQSIARDPRRYL